MRMEQNSKKIQRLKLEREIRRGLKRACFGLHKIHAKGLWEPDYPSFESYALAVWGYSRSYAYRLLNYVDFVKLSPIGDLSTQLSEGAYRPIHKLKQPDEKRQAYEKLTALIQGGETITEDVTDRIVSEIKPQVLKEKPHAGIDIDEFGERAHTLAGEVQKIIVDLYAATNPEDPVAGLNAIMQLADIGSVALKEFFGTSKPVEAAKRLEVFQAGLKVPVPTTIELKSTSDAAPEANLAKRTNAEDTGTPSEQPAITLEDVAEVVATAPEGAPARESVDAEINIDPVIQPVADVSPRPELKGQAEPSFLQSPTEEPTTVELQGKGLLIVSSCVRGADSKIRLSILVTPGRTALAAHCPTPPLFDRVNDTFPLRFEREIPESRLPLLHSQIRLAVNYLVQEGKVEMLGHCIEKELMEELADWIVCQRYQGSVVTSLRR